MVEDDRRYIDTAELSQPGILIAEVKGLREDLDRYRQEVRSLIDQRTRYYRKVFIVIFAAMFIWAAGSFWIIDTRRDDLAGVVDQSCQHLRETRDVLVILMDDLVALAEAEGRGDLPSVQIIVDARDRLRLDPCPNPEKMNDIHDSIVNGESSLNSVRNDGS